MISDEELTVETWVFESFSVRWLIYLMDLVVENLL